MNVQNRLSYGVIHDGIVCLAYFHKRVFWSLVRNSVVLAVYLFKSVLM